MSFTTQEIWKIEELIGINCYNNLMMSFYSKSFDQRDSTIIVFFVMSFGGKQLSQKIIVTHFYWHKIFKSYHKDTSYMALTVYELRFNLKFKNMTRNKFLWEMDRLLLLT